MSLYVLCYVCFVLCCVFFFFFKQKTAYEMRISDWSSDVCSSESGARADRLAQGEQGPVAGEVGKADAGPRIEARRHGEVGDLGVGQEAVPLVAGNDMQLQRLEPAALALGIEAACLGQHLAWLDEDAGAEALAGQVHAAERAPGIFAGVGEHATAQRRRRGGGRRRG